MRSPTPLRPFRAVLIAITAVTLSVQAAAPLRVLYFTKSAGYEHDVVRWRDGQPSYTERVLNGLAERNNLQFTFSKDGSLFSPEYLAQFDVLMFFTSGDLFNVGTDGHPAMTPAGKQALIDAVAGGKGFVGVHSGNATFHTGESGPGLTMDRARRYRNNGADADPYIQMVGGEFIGHGDQQVARATVVDPHFPGCAAVGGAFECLEEWYSIKDFAPNLHALLIMQTQGMKGSDYQRPPYPLSWTRMHGKGRVWFNAMGHREDVWDNPKFQAMLVGGLLWAGGRLEADITPNLAAVAPEASTLPPPPSR